ncbi:protein phosphatase 2C domain-containing protein [Actinomadura parmotrematis]|uniref:Protein phosphatase 2C domain-containing protein n=1 Tax=Actinomadura parmotrematis TaxID=2864039 RepID=A0ABS7FZ33_9ACTN|nr:protein phosphatase 2C domain-containing protein [Actinomadura parmotrematis]MBW8485531.1 protein phosphatase 2C domain-containing protein [Actinomadura parmotrematis]
MERSETDRPVDSVRPSGPVQPVEEIGAVGAAGAVRQAGAERPSAPPGDAAPAADVPPPLVIGRPSRLRSAPGRPPAAPHPKLDAVRPDSEIDGAELPGLVVRAASVRGDAHRYQGTLRQDSMKLRPLGEDGVVLCVADGLGSRPLSHVGSDRAVQEASRHVPAFMDAAEPAKAAAALVHHVSHNLREYAVWVGVDGEDLATTLVAGGVRRREDGTALARLARVGDSTALYLRNDDWTSCFPTDPDTAVATSATAALPAKAPDVQVADLVLRPGDLLVLCTDGLERPMRGDEVRRRLADWWSRPEPPSLPEFHWQFSFRARTHDDDRTAICVWAV